MVLGLDGVFETSFSMNEAIEGFVGWSHRGFVGFAGRRGRHYNGVKCMLGWEAFRLDMRSVRLEVSMNYSLGCKDFKKRNPSYWYVFRWVNWWAGWVVQYGLDVKSTQLFFLQTFKGTHRIDYGKPLITLHYCRVLF